MERESTSSIRPNKKPPVQHTLVAHMSLIKFWRFTGVGRPLQEEGNIVEDVQLSGRWNVISIYQLKKLLKLMACYMLHAVASWRPTCMLHADRSRSTQFLIVTEDQLDLQSTNPVSPSESTRRITSHVLE